MLFHMYALYAECRYVDIILLSVVMLDVILLCVVMLSVVAPARKCFLSSSVKTGSKFYFSRKLFIKTSVLNITKEASNDEREAEMIILKVSHFFFQLTSPNNFAFLK
jgi:hypothetical protein